MGVRQQLQTSLQATWQDWLFYHYTSTRTLAYQVRLYEFSPTPYDVLTSYEEGHIAVIVK